MPSIGKINSIAFTFVSVKTLEVSSQTVYFLSVPSAFAICICRQMECENHVKFFFCSLYFVTNFILEFM
jgi:hypothetical protein